LLALLGAHPIFHVSRIRIKVIKFFKMGLVGKGRGRDGHESHELIQAILVTIVKESDNLGDRRAGEIILN